MCVLAILHLARFTSPRVKMHITIRAQDLTLMSLWRRNNLDLSRISRAYARIHTHARARERERERGREEWQEGEGEEEEEREGERERQRFRRVKRKAARCEPDEPRTNRATNQWCDGPSLPSLTQRVYHTETDRRKSSDRRGER